MLKQRVITALALLALLLPTLFMASPEPFIVLALFMVAAGAWEWGRLSGLTFPGSVSNAAILSVGLLAWWGSGYLQLPSSVWMLPSLAWVTMLRKISSRSRNASSAARRSDTSTM